MLLTYYLYNTYKDFYLINGGTSTLVSYGLVDSDAGKRIDIPPEHLDFFRGLIPYYETEDYIFVHAGLKPGISLYNQDPTDMLWIRHDFIDSDYDFGKKIIFGHTPLPRPFFGAGKIGIDTGAVYGGKLTCLQLPDEIIYQV
jgi:serine/threonine protein phosphatase 1